MRGDHADDRLPDLSVVLPEVEVLLFFTSNRLTHSATPLFDNEFLLMVRADLRVVRQSQVTAEDIDA